MQVETVERFLARGGTIKTCPPAGGGSLSHSGTVKSVNGKGRGFIEDDTGGSPVILTARHWNRETQPKAGDRVLFDVSIGHGRKFAVSCRPALEVRPRSR